MDELTNDTIISFIFWLQLLGYGWAGLFRKYLVDSSYMWWPGNLVQVSLFRFDFLLLHVYSNL